MSAGSDRLERTRLAILEHVHRRDQRRHGYVPGPEAQPGQEAPRGRRAAPGGGWYGHARETLHGWWQYHPARAAVELARPALSSYARRKPLQFLGIAALAGAGLMFMRPWKLISVTGVLVALVKSPQVAALVMSAMSSSQNPRDDEPIEE